MESNWLVKIFATIFFVIDRLVYGFIAVIYNLLLEISQVSIFRPETIMRFGKNIYVILGIFMLFKVSLSLITYVVNPDSFNDKEKGVGNLIKNSLVMLVLLVLTPWIFNQAYDIQRIILKDNTLGHIILGMNSSGKNFKNNAGNQMAYLTFTAFFNIDTDVHPECDVITGAHLNYDESVTQNRSRACASRIGDVYYNKFLTAKNENSVKPLFEDVSLIWAKTSNDQNVISYTFIISSAAAIVILLVLINFCFDVAVRSVKFGFLQLIAPIPIISMMDPKSSKSGMFSKWVKECTKTYLDLFVRLAAIYFAVFIISEIATGGLHNVLDPNAKISLMAKVFIILGALIFAKKLPDLISDLTGMKLGSFSLNPMKKVSESPFAAAAVGGAAGLVGGMAANTFGSISNIQRKFKENPNLTAKEALFGKKEFFGGKKGFDALVEGRRSLKNLRHNSYGSVLAGGTSSAFRAIKGGLSGGGKTDVGQLTKSSIKASSQARNQRDIGYNMQSKIIDDYRDIAGIKNTYGTTNKIKGQIKGYTQELENLKQQEQAILQQQNLILGQNPDLALAYREANKVIWDDNKPGESQYAFSSYEEYERNFIDLLEKATAENNTLEIERLNAMGVLNKQQFERIRALDIERETYDKRGKDLEKKIKSLEEDMYKAGKKE